jgi:RimJ/RimL family protein N-acetyltransferase
MDDSEAMGAEVYVKRVEDGDVEAFYQHQADPQATRMAAFPAREREAFAAHWATLRADPAIITETIVAAGQVAGNVVSWEQSGERLVGYWIGRQFWGRGIATRALQLFVLQVRSRPLYAHVAAHNVASMRVLQKCGFRETAVGEPPAVADGDGVAEVVFTLDD